ncbi:MULTISPECIES: helix-turn-helix domain-containing protein [Empedobacter]|uniref:helix-turn-helix domain-containing protein n=1 Tax=Empedobacter TaxID=59734 RepID=UPI0025C2C3D2|nr:MULTISPECIES: helix-turn-helix domain-containing protein [unclassified Empedobacter]
MVQETILISLAYDQLETLIDNCVSKAIRNHSTQLQKVEEKQPEYLTRRQTASKLHLSLGTLDQYVKSGLITSYKIGHRVLFKSNEINDSLFQSIQNQKFKTK